jgi:hypothetical protein
MHYLLQRLGGGLKKFASECDSKVDDWRLMMGHLRAANVPLKETRLLEMGTGWYPTFPFCLYLAGAGRVDTLDLNPYLKPEMTLALAERLESHLTVIAEESGRTESDIRTLHARLLRSLRQAGALSAQQLLREATEGVVHYAAPADAARTGFDAGTIGVVFSNSVLEHVPRAIIQDCFVEAFRILEPRGIVLHSVNCGDHYAYVDSKVHQLHYLKYSDAAWKKWNNAFLYQNRLRAVDFTKMAEDAGFQVEIDTSTPRPERLRQLDAIDVDPVFSRYTREQLCITTIDFVGRKPG